MAATFPTLSFDSVCVDIQDKRILWDVSGRAEKGEILAIMGPSGERVRTPPTAYFTVQTVCIAGKYLLFPYSYIACGFASSQRVFSSLHINGNCQVLPEAHVITHSGIY